MANRPRMIVPILDIAMLDALDPEGLEKLSEEFSGLFPDYEVIVACGVGGGITIIPPLGGTK